MNKTLLLYVFLAIAVTIGTLYYQHETGPTYEKEITTTLAGNTYDFELPRSHDNTVPCIINLVVPDTAVSGTVDYKRYPTNDAYTTIEMYRVGDTLKFELPNQPMAGKLQYRVRMGDRNSKEYLDEGKPIVIRYKGHVPLWVLRIHIFLMFSSYFFAIFAGLLALFGQRKYQFYSMLTVVLLGLGGLVLGPIVQKYAFGVWWSGVPFGWDLTDNKLLIAFLVWLIAWWVNRKSERRWWVVAAMVVHIIVYSIPHSAMGSELDYESGQVGTSEKFKD